MAAHRRQSGEEMNQNSTRLSQYHATRLVLSYGNDMEAVPVEEGKEAAAENEKQVAFEERKQIRPEIDNKEVDSSSEHTQYAKTSIRTARVFGLSRRSFVLLAVVSFIALVVVGLAAGLTQVLKNGTKHKPDTDPLAMGGALDRAYLSRKGAMNGTSLAITSPIVKNDGKQVQLLLYQHHTGQIRYLQFTTTDGTYNGGSQSEIIAIDAKNATPIAAVQYMINQIMTTHVFYAGQDGYMKQRTMDNTTGFWTDGPATAQNFSLLDSPAIGIQACWYGNFHLNNSLGSWPDNTTNVIGMQLWFSTQDDTYQQYGWFDGRQEWFHQHTWSGFNAHIKPGCYSWRPGTIDYVMLANEQSSPEVWWRDANVSLPSTATHPTNSWTKAANVSLPDIQPASSMHYISNLYTLQPDTSVRSYNISFTAENTEVVDGFTLQSRDGPVHLLNGTKLAANVLPSSDDGLKYMVIAQIDGDDISVVAKDHTSEKWTISQLPVDKP